MRHRKKGTKFGRTTGPRQALIRGLMRNLILHESITTTEAKARAIRPLVEKIVTKGKKNTLATRRELMKDLYTQNTVKKVLEVLSPKYLNRKGGYLRIIKLGMRQGDAAKIVQIEFV